MTPTVGVAEVGIFDSLTDAALSGQIDWLGHDIRAALLGPFTRPEPSWKTWSQVDGECASADGYLTGGITLPDRTRRVLAHGSAWTSGPARWANVTLASSSVVIYDATTTALICWLTFAETLTPIGGMVQIVPPETGWLISRGA